MYSVSQKTPKLEVVEESECSNSVPLVEKGTSEDEIGDGS